LCNENNALDERPGFGGSGNIALAGCPPTGGLRPAARAPTRHRIHHQEETVLTRAKVPPPAPTPPSSARPARGGAAGVALVVAGTRPECIKLAPVLVALARCPALAGVVVNSGQHRDAVRQTLAGFGLGCDVELEAQPARPNLRTACADLRRRLATAIVRVRPAFVLVQGDTLTAYAGARAGRDAGCPVVHVEAGLRTGSPADPFPEEWFRRRIARHAQLHFAPSRSAAANLLREGIDAAAIHRVGNTGIDSLRALLDGERDLLRSRPERAGRVLVTLHRRENWDAPADVVCDALLELIVRRPALRVLFPLHPNPRIARRMTRRLGAHPAFDLVGPLPYPEFIRAAAGAALIVSDSGGIQEEAPHLGVPLLVPRANTERGESLATGFVRLVAIDRQLIVEAALAMLAAPRGAPVPFDAEAPYGAGDAAARIVAVLERSFGTSADEAGSRAGPRDAARDFAA